VAEFRHRDLQSSDPAELRRQLNAELRSIEAELAGLRARGAVSSVQVIDYTARFGEVARVAPPSTGLRVTLPPALLAQTGKSSRVVVVVEGEAGALTVEAVDATVNGEDTLTFAAGIGTVEFVLTEAGWHCWSGSMTTATWAQVLANGASSGAFSPSIDDGQKLLFGSLGELEATADLTITAGADMHLHPSGTLHLGHTTTTDSVHVEAAGAIELLTSAGPIELSSGSTIDEIAATVGNYQAPVINLTASDHVHITAGFLKFTEVAASTPSMSAGQGLLWLQNTTPNNPRFTDDANTDWHLAVGRDGNGITWNGTSRAFDVNRATDYDWTGVHSFADEATFNGHATFSDRVGRTGVFTITLTGGTNNLAIGAVGVARISLTGSQTLTGMVPGLTGQTVWLFNADSADTLTLAHLSGSSSAANQFLCPNNANYALPPRCGVGLWHDPSSSLWFVLGK
jgi:hypothetical protein